MTAAFDGVLVIAADDERARLVRRGKDAALEILWEGYAASKNVRDLGQSPDVTRNSRDATPPFAGESRQQFAGDVAERVASLVGERPALRILVIAPPSFAGALQHALGGMWPAASDQIIGRDETALDDDGLRAFVGATLAAHPQWTTTVV